MANGITVAEVNRIKELAEGKQYEEAIELIRNQDLTKSLNPQFLRVCGEVMLATGNYNESRHALLLAHNIAPGGNRIIYFLVLLYLEVGEFEKAATYLEIYKYYASEGDIDQIKLEYEFAKSKKATPFELFDIYKPMLTPDRSDEISYEFMKLYKAKGENENFEAEYSFLHDLYQSSDYLEKAKALKEKRIKDAETELYCYPETSILEPNEEIDAYEAGLLERDENILHPGEAKILLMDDEIEDLDQLISQSTLNKWAMKRQEKADKRAAKKADKKKKQEERKAKREAVERGELPPEAIEENFADSVDAVKEAVAEKAGAVKNVAQKTAVAVKDKVAEKGGEIKDAVSEKVSEVKDTEGSEEVGMTSVLSRVKGTIFGGKKNKEEPVAEEPVKEVAKEEPKEEIKEEPKEEVKSEPEVVEDALEAEPEVIEEEIAEETVEEPVEEAVEEAVEEVAEVEPEVIEEEIAEEAIEETVEEAVEEVVEAEPEIVEEVTEAEPEVVEEVMEAEPEVVEEVAEPEPEVIEEEIAEEAIEETVEEIVEETVEEPIEETIEETVEEVIEEPVEPAPSSMGFDDEIAALLAEADSVLSGGTRWSDMKKTPEEPKVRAPRTEKDKHDYVFDKYDEMLEQGENKLSAKFDREAEMLKEAEALLASIDAGLDDWNSKTKDGLFEAFDRYEEKAEKAEKAEQDTLSKISEAKQDVVEETVTETESSVSDEASVEPEIHAPEETVVEAVSEEPVEETVSETEDQPEEYDPGYYEETTVLSRPAFEETETHPEEPEAFEETVVESYTETEVYPETEVYSETEDYPETTVYEEQVNEEKVEETSERVTVLEPEPEYEEYAKNEDLTSTAHSQDVEHKATQDNKGSHSDLRAYTKQRLVVDAVKLDILQKLKERR